MSQFTTGHLYDVAFAALTPQEIEDNLEAVAYDLEERSYTKNLTDEEILEKKDEFSEVNIELSDLNQKKKDFLDTHKIAEKGVKLQAGILLDAIKYKSEQRFGKLFLVDDQESGMMYTFDHEGICIEQRQLTRKEKQTKLRVNNG